MKRGKTSILLTTKHFNWFFFLTQSSFSPSGPSASFFLFNMIPIFSSSSSPCYYFCPKIASICFFLTPHFFFFSRALNLFSPLFSIFSSLISFFFVFSYSSFSSFGFSSDLSFSCFLTRSPLPLPKPFTNPPRLFF